MAETPSHFSEFDAAAVGEALGTERRTVRDVAHGDGEALDVGETTLEVYREAGVARVTTADARIELFRVPEYSIRGGRVVFEQGDKDSRSRLQVRADGKVAFHPVLRAAESSTTTEIASSGEQDTTPLVGSSGGTTTRSDSTAADGSAGQEQREQELQQLQGRLGRDPWYNSQGDQPIAGFPLAVNDEQGATTWHRVVVFGDIADQVKTGLQTGQIKKGRLVQLTGTAVVRQEDNGKGGTRSKTEFHAASVTRMKTATVPHPQGR